MLHFGKAGIFWGGCKAIGAQLGVEYQFRVFVVNSFGDGDTATGSARASAFAMPTAPRNFKAVDRNQTLGRDIDVTWDTPGTLNAAQITRYRVRQIFTFRNLVVNTHLNNVVSNSELCAPLVSQPRSCLTFMSNGNPMSFTVTSEVSTPSLDADGNLVAGTTESEAAVINFVPSGTPFAPVSLSATAGVQSISATWNEPPMRQVSADWIQTPGNNGSPITNYKATAVNAFTGLVEGECVVATPLASGNRCTITNLKKGVAYNVNVVSINAKGASAAASVSNITPT